MLDCADEGPGRLLEIDPDFSATLPTALLDLGIGPSPALPNEYRFSAAEYLAGWSSLQDAP
jgi:hypothetical protein